jgi:hypothetical protein
LSREIIDILRYNLGHLFEIEMMAEEGSLNPTYPLAVYVEADTYDSCNLVPVISNFENAARNLPASTRIR